MNIPSAAPRGCGIALIYIRSDFEAPRSWPELCTHEATFSLAGFEPMDILEWIGAFTVTVGVIIGGFALMLSVQNANRS